MTYGVSHHPPFVRPCGPRPSGLHDPWRGSAAQPPCLSKVLAVRRPSCGTFPCQFPNSAKGMLFVKGHARFEHAIGEVHEFPHGRANGMSGDLLHGFGRLNLQNVGKKPLGSFRAEMRPQHYLVASDHGCRRTRVTIFAPGVADAVGMLGSRSHAPGVVHAVLPLYARALRSAGGSAHELPRSLCTIKRALVQS
jgi:hypothetical protein